MMNKELADTLLNMNENTAYRFATLYSLPNPQTGELAVSLDIDNNLEPIFKDEIPNMMILCNTISNLYSEHIIKDICTSEGDGFFMETLGYCILNQGGNFYIVMQCPYLSEHMAKPLGHKYEKSVKDIIDEINKQIIRMANTINKELDEYLNINE